MTAEELDALATKAGKLARFHDGCDFSCECRQRLELARGYLSLRLVQADHERQIAALQAAFDDMQKAYLHVCGVERFVRVNALEHREAPRDYLTRHCMCVWPNTDPRCDIHRDGIGAPAGV